MTSSLLLSLKPSFKVLREKSPLSVSHSKMAHQASYYLRTSRGYAPFCHIQRKHIKVLRKTRYREFIHQHRHRFNYVGTRASISHSSQNPPEVYSGTHSHVLECKEMPFSPAPLMTFQLLPAFLNCILSLIKVSPLFPESGTHSNESPSWVEPSPQTTEAVFELVAYSRTTS